MARVLLVTDIFPPQIGGPATFVNELAYSLAAKGHKATVICASDMPNDKFDQFRPFSVIRISTNNWYTFELKFRTVLAFELLRTDHILVNGLEHLTYQVSRLLHRRYLLKIVADTVWETGRNFGITAKSVEDFQREEIRDYKLKKLKRRRHNYLEFSKLVITPSNHVKNLVIGWGLEPSRIKVIPNGISLKDFDQYQPKRRNPGSFRIAYSGRLTNLKGIETLLLATKEMNNVQLSIIGEGLEMPMLVGLSEQLGISSNVRFIGRLDRKALHKELGEHHVFALPSLTEGHSHMLLEASAIGLPCIASHSGGNPEIIRSGLNGLLVPYGEVHRLRQALELLQFDEDYRYYLACNAKNNIQRFDQEQTIHKVIDTLLAS